jgi:hypothetical protein
MVSSEVVILRECREVISPQGNRVVVFGEVFSVKCLKELQQQ